MRACVRGVCVRASTHTLHFIVFIGADGHERATGTDEEKQWPLNLSLSLSLSLSLTYWGWHIVCPSSVPTASRPNHPHQPTHTHTRVVNTDQHYERWECLRVAPSECFKSQIHETEEGWGGGGRKGGRKRADYGTQERGDDEDDYDEVIMINNRFVVNRRSLQVCSSQTLRQSGQPCRTSLWFII